MQLEQFQQGISYSTTKQQEALFESGNLSFRRANTKDKLDNQKHFLYRCATYMYLIFIAASLPNS